MKKLSEYIAHLELVIADLRLNGNPQISSVTNDSRQVEAGSLFIAVKGEAADGHNYIDKAVAAGAAAVVCAEGYHCNFKNVITVKDSYYAYALAAECFYDFPARNMIMTGITGTNGKTTTAFILEHILSDSGRPCGLVSTVKYMLGGEVIEASRTTPEAAELQSYFRKMADAGCSNVVMETSSHGLYQHRMGSARFKVGIFTNLTGDHLDYHKDMESYFQAKKILFTDYLDSGEVMVVNADDPYGQRLLRETDCKALAFGQGADSDLKIEDIELSAVGTCFALVFKGQRFEFRTEFTGEHNVYNVTAACGAALALDVDMEFIRDALSAKLEVPGRLERFTAPDRASVYVDYAHTDDALKNVLSILQKICRGKLIAVFGCGGDRDSSKRPRMGKVAAQYADKIILTNDNPRTEDPNDIIADILTGIPGTATVETITDRAAAIKAAIAGAASDDVILVAGKGHETYQEQNEIFSDFDDRAVVKAVFAETFTD